MRRYVVKRLISLLGTLLGVSVLIFLMVHLIPGDPATQILGQFATPEAISQMRTALGLDQPLWQQYVGFLGRLLTGDRGRSLFPGESVGSRWSRFPLQASGSPCSSSGFLLTSSRCFRFPAMRAFIPCCCQPSLWAWRKRG